MNDVQNAEKLLLLRMENITKRFPGVIALSGVHFDLYPGEVHLILGENGAGKSTLIKILSGVYHPDGGEIYIGGRKVEIQNPHHAKELSISTIYQDFALIPQLTVAQNIFLGREIEENHFNFLIDNRKMNEECFALLERLEIPLNPKQLVRSLNTAEKQLVEIARALSTKSKILIMDEPTSTLTPKEIERLFTMVHQLKKQGVGIIYISHRLEEAIEIGDRATVLRDGEYIITLYVKEADVNQMISLMVGEEITERFPKEAIEIGEEVLRVQGLSKSPFFNDISFSLRKGEILGLSGLLGSGKEKVLRSIYGIEGPATGSIELYGQKVKIGSCRDAINCGITYLPSDKKVEGCALRMDVSKNMTLASLKNFCRLGMIKLKRESEIANEFVRNLSIRTPSIQTLVEYLSGGNQQKVIIAKSLCCKSNIFLFDEPTQGIDVGAKVEIYNLLSELVKQGASIVIASSEMAELTGMCDRIITMYRGMVVGEFCRDHFDQEIILRYIFGKEREPCFERVNGF